MKIYLALYKHKREITSLQNLYFRIFDEVIKLFTKGKYSHCEIAIKKNDSETYLCYSSSNRDGGVREKEMILSLDRWDLIDISKSIKETDLTKFFSQTKGLKYDFFGAIGVVLGFGNKKEKYFCSEWCAELLGYKRPHKFSPVSLSKSLLNRGYKFK